MQGVLVSVSVSAMCILEYSYRIVLDRARIDILYFQASAQDRALHEASLTDATA